MKHSPLGRLPPELRNHIYHLALYEPKPIVVRPYGYEIVECNKSRTQPPPCPSPVALTITCKAIRQESVQVFYAINTFMVADAEGSPEHAVMSARDFIAQIRQRNSLAVRSMIVDIGELGGPQESQVLGAIAFLFRTAQTKSLIDFSITWSVEVRQNTGRYGVDLHIRDLEGSLASQYGRLERRMVGVRPGTKIGKALKKVRDSLESVQNAGWLLERVRAGRDRHEGLGGLEGDVDIATNLNAGC